MFGCVGDYETSVSVWVLLSAKVYRLGDLLYAGFSLIPLLVFEDRILFHRP